MLFPIFPAGIFYLAWTVSNCVLDSAKVVPGERDRNVSKELCAIQEHLAKGDPPSPAPVFSLSLLLTTPSSTQKEAERPSPCNTFPVFAVPDRAVSGWNLTQGTVGVAVASQRDGVNFNTSRVT